MDTKRKGSTWPIIFIAIVCYWLGYKAGEFNFEMSGTAGTPFSAYVRVER